MKKISKATAIKVACVVAIVLCLGLEVAVVSGAYCPGSATTLWVDDTAAESVIRSVPVVRKCTPTLDPYVLGNAQRGGGPNAGN